MGLQLKSLSIAAAAAALGERRGTIERWIREGAPVVQHGTRGRGKRTLVDVVALDAWRNGTRCEVLLLELAAVVPDLIADAIDGAFCAVSGPHKRALAEPLSAAWYVASVALLDRLRRDAPAIPELSAVPEKITRLRSIFGDTHTLIEIRNQDRRDGPTRTGRLEPSSRRT